MQKQSVFEPELGLIKNTQMHAVCCWAVSLLPDYFFTVPASSTGKYHPDYALGDGGLVRHTKAAVQIASELLNLEMYGRYTEAERDLIFAALILHDGRKHGEKYAKYVKAAHPTIMADWLSKNAEGLLPPHQLAILCGAVASHMGQWNTDLKTKKEILPKPRTPIEKFVHQCDYLASRKFLEVRFAPYYDPKNFAGEESAPPQPEPCQKETGLEAAKQEVLKLCKEKIAAGVCKDAVYQTIADHNGGSRNPNAIQEESAAKNIIQALEGLNHERT